MIVYKLLNRHIPYIFHLCCFVCALIDRFNPLTLTSCFWLIRFIKIIDLSVSPFDVFPLPLFSYSSFHFATNLINLNRSTVFICIIKSTTVRSQSNEFSLEAIEMEVIEKNWYFLCSNSERNEQHCEGSCGTEKIVFVVHTGENEFQTRRHERVNHKELAKSVERTTSGAIRMNRNWDESKYFRNNSTIPTRILRI